MSLRRGSVSVPIQLFCTKIMPISLHEKWKRIEAHGQVHMDLVSIGMHMGIGSKIQFVKLPLAFAKNHEPWVPKEPMT
jgi:hypothetical protein